MQDELSKSISELLFCFQGTVEEDEYAGELYLEYTADEDLPNANNDDDEDEDVSMEVDDEIVPPQDNSESDTTSETIEEEESDDEEASGDELLNQSADAMTLRHGRGAHLASVYFRTFFRTMKSQWGLMDYHRMDKFYTLIRFMIRSAYDYMSQRGYSLGIVRLFNDALHEEALKHGDSNGIRLHLCDVALDEFHNVVSKEKDTKIVTEAYLSVLEPFLALLQNEKNDAVHARLVDQFEKHAFANKELAAFIFEIASDEFTLDKRRESLYRLHKEFLKKCAEEEAKMKAIQEKEMKMKAIKEKEEKEKAEIERSKSLSAKKKKKKKKGNSGKATGNTNSDFQAENQCEQSDIDEIQKSKKKSKKGKDSKIDSNETLNIVSESSTFEATSDKKKKKRKKLSDSKSTKDIIITDSKTSKDSNINSKHPPNDISESGTSEATSERKKKKKRKSSDSKTTDIDVEDNVMTTPKKSKDSKNNSKDPINVVSESNKSGATSDKKKKKKRDSKSTSSIIEDDVMTTPKRSNKSREKFGESVLKNVRGENSQEEEILITLEDQKADREAKSSSRRKKRQKEKNATVEEVNEDESNDTSKSVKFKRVNQAKSYKASMKGLRNAEIELSKTPDKGILLVKESKSNEKGKKKKSSGESSTKRKGQRRKASDFF